MRRSLKWLGITLGALLVLAVLAAVVLNVAGAAHLNKAREAPADSLAIPAYETASPAANT